MVFEVMVLDWENDGRATKMGVIDEVPCKLSYVFRVWF